jgi:hypothetical protein
MCCCTVQHWLPGFGGSNCCGHHAAAEPAKKQKIATTPDITITNQANISTGDRRTTALPLA